MSEKTHRTEEELNGPGTRDELTKLLGEFRIGILVTRDDAGLPRARPLAIAKVDADGSVWFASSDHTPKIDEIARDGHVAVVCHRTRDEAWISLSGKATLVRDRAKVKDLWDVGMKAWFDGPDDPALILIHVTPAHAEYYDPGKPFIVRAFEIVKGIVSKDPPKVGTTRHVELDRLSEPGRLTR